MNALFFPSTAPERSMLGAIFARVSSLFYRSNSAAVALAGSLAGELRARPELSSWVLSLKWQSPRARATSLLRAASSLRGEWSTCGAADALKRMAARTGIFKAVVRELRQPSAASVN